MRCAELDELISAYADGQTVPAQTELVEAHIRGCPRCHAVFIRNQQTRRLMHLLNDNTWTPPDMRLRVTHAYRQEQRQGRHPVQIGGLAACVAIVVLLAGILTSQAVVPHAATPAQVPVAHLAAAIEPTVMQHAVASTPSNAAVDWAVCRRLAKVKQAECLGVSPHFLPALLAEEVDFAGQRQESVVQPPLNSEPSSPMIAGVYAKKGGGARRVTMSIRGGLQPI